MYHVDAFFFNSTKEFAKPLNYFRMRLDQVKLIPDIAYNKFFKNMAEPAKKEGFTEVRTINFIPDFSNKDLETVFRQFSEK